jgi:hypothetical protein
MVRWSGDWFGHWQGDWQGEGSAGGVVNAALIVNGGSEAFFHAVDLTPPAVVTPSGGGARVPTRRKTTYLRAALHAEGVGLGRFGPLVGRVQPVALAAAGAHRATLVAAVGRVSPLALASAGRGAARFGAVAGRVKPAALPIAGRGTATFSATVDTRTVVVPIRPRVELADDELLAILMLMAA